MCEVPLPLKRGTYNHRSRAKFMCLEMKCCTIMLLVCSAAPDVRDIWTSLVICVCAASFPTGTPKGCTVFSRIQHDRKAILQHSVL